MHDWQTGRLVVATPALEDPNFERSVVLILDHDHDGALGVVLNRASDLAIDDALSGWVDLVAAPSVVFGGGPVEPTAVVALGRATASVPADQGLSPRLDRVRLVDLGDDPALAAVDLERVRVFAGYAGWGPGQLEAEVDAGAWFTVDADPADVFTADPGRLWQAVLRRQPDELALFATFPEDPSLN
ncbi:YqgE/AlgH family protein [Egicoccus sp. AB-alg6-2]|uniref:YqgE/AlgH family protein n=1 Tax=Egicoccus sp. AB-alg6-2 TaxID=3242692 RepID=UPI00359EE5D7